jgi:hypothetical protein
MYFRSADLPRALLLRSEPLRPAPASPPALLLLLLPPLALLLPPLALLLLPLLLLVLALAPLSALLLLLLLDASVSAASSSSSDVRMSTMGLVEPTASGSMVRSMSSACVVKSTEELMVSVNFTVQNNGNTAKYASKGAA